MAQKQKQSFFYWNRINNNSNSRGKKGKGSAIEDWIQKVQNDSNLASREVSGDEIPDLNNYIPDDEAIYEAQELVGCWMRDESSIAVNDIENELTYRNEAWNSTVNSFSHKHKHVEIDDFDNNGNSNSLEQIHVHDYIHDNDISASSRNYSSTVDIHKMYDPIENDDDDGIEDALLVQDVLHGMLCKDFHKDIDLALKPKKAIDPIPKMDLRHKQVKLRGEKRRKNNIEKKKKVINQKDIVHKARERVLIEERERIEKEKYEEKAILTEMEKIKHELAKEKMRKQDEIRQKERVLNEAKLQMQLELKEEREKELLKRKKEKESRLQTRRVIEEDALRDLQHRMKFLHKYFSVWYDVVLEKRLKLGKAQAVADWKCKMKAWNAWRGYVCCVKTNHEAKEIEKAVKEKYRKEQMAVTHAKQKVLFKCFLSWQKYSHYKSEKALIKLEHEKTSKKIALFLEAASTGTLWTTESKKDIISKSEHGGCHEICQFKNKNEKTIIENFELISNTDISNRKGIFGVNQTIQETKNVKQPLVNNGNPMVMKANDIINSNENLSNEQLNVVQNSKTVNSQKLNIVTQSNSSKEKKNNVPKRIFSKSKPKEILSIESVKSEFDPPLVSNDSNFDERDENFKTSESSSLFSSRQRVSSAKQSTKPLYLAMEEREKERQKRKAVIHEEKKKKDEERLALLQAKEAERIRLEQLEKEEQLRRQKEQKKLEVQKQKEKEFQIDKLRLKNVVAKEHYQKSLLRKYGMNSLKQIVRITNVNLEKSIEYHNSLLLKSCFIEWHLYVKQVTNTKNEKAEECYQTILKKRAFYSWLKCRFYLQNMNMVARNFSMKIMLRHTFNAWQEYVTDERILMWAKESNAEEHDMNRLKKYSFNSWKSFVKSEKEDKKREYRKEALRKKVQSWLPDYKTDFESTPFD